LSGRDRRKTHHLTAARFCVGYFRVIRSRVAFREPCHSQVAEKLSNYCQFWTQVPGTGMRCVPQFAVSLARRCGATLQSLGAEVYPSAEVDLLRAVLRADQLRTELTVDQRTCSIILEKCWRSVASASYQTSSAFEKLNVAQDRNHPRRYDSAIFFHIAITRHRPTRVANSRAISAGHYQIGVPSLSRKVKVSDPRVTSRAKIVSTPSNSTFVPTTVTISPLLNTRS
jgi:hypothetical protein